MKRVLVTRLDSLGDVLLAGPAIRAVAAAAEVTLLCGPRGAAAGRLLPGVSDLLTWEAPWIDPEPKPVSQAEVDGLVSELCRRGFQDALVLGSYHQSPLPMALLLRLAGIKRVAAVSEMYAGSLLDVRLRYDPELHEVERALEVARALGYELPAGDGGELRVRVEATLPPEVAALGGFVAVHPGVSVPARAWAPERHAALVDLLVESGRRVVVTGGGGEKELTRLVAGRPRAEVVDLGGRCDLRGLARVLRSADALVAGNTGPAHLAAAVGTPVVSLFSPVVSARNWRPWGVPVAILGDRDAPCAGTRARQCAVPGHPCLNVVLPEQALDALERLA